jgi:hypothetical protein
VSEHPEALVGCVVKALFCSPVSDNWGENVPEIAAVCERAAIAALDALGLREETVRPYSNDLKYQRRRYVTDWDDS